MSRGTGGATVFSNDVAPSSEPSGAGGAEGPAGHGAPAPSRIAFVVLAVGVLLFGALAVAAWVFHEQSEDHLLQERADEAGALIQVSVGNIQSQLTGAAAIAN